MAIVAMKKFRLIGLSSEKQKIIGALLRSGSVQLKPTEEIDLTVRGLDGEKLDDAASVYSRVGIALEFLKKQKREAAKEIKNGALSAELLPKEKGGLFQARESVSADDFENVELQRSTLLNVCDILENNAARRNELKTRRAALRAEDTDLKKYVGFDLKFSDLQQGKSVDFLLGLTKANKTAEKELRALAEKYEAACDVSPVTDEKDKVVNFLVFMAVRKERRAELESDLAAYAYAPCPYTYGKTVKERRKEIEEEIVGIDAQTIDDMKAALAYLKYEKQLQLLFDNYAFRMETIRADANFAKTEKTFILECFTPAECAEKVEKIIDKTTKNVSLAFYDVEESDRPPTLLKNNKVVAPYEAITNTYSPPNYYETDPNPFVAIFYFIFFGIMLGDVGYGAILAIACFALVKFVKMEDGMKSMLLVFGMGGLSAIIWGFLFGGIFSIDSPSIKPLLFSPMQSPIPMLILCFALGLLQILTGMGIQAHEFIKQGHAADAVYDIFSWYAIFLGGGIALIPNFIEGMPAIMTKIGLVILILGVATLMFGGAIRSKGFFGRIIGAVKPLYGIVNFFSDVMSYSRLFGLCLASGIIGLVFNTLAGVIAGMIPVAGYVIAAIIAVIGHTLNFAIGLLGIYVHDSRLQFIEFFGRFYHGGGRAFSPLGLNLKYVTIKQEV